MCELSLAPLCGLVCQYRGTLSKRFLPRCDRRLHCRLDAVLARLLPAAQGTRLGTKRD